MRDKKEVRTFTDLITQEMSLLEPFARSVKCLESSASTPADVAFFWLASLAVLHNTFTDSDKRDELMLTEDTITEVRSIVNGRYNEMVKGADQQVYLATLFLDFREYSVVKLFWPSLESDISQTTFHRHYSLVEI